MLLKKNFLHKIVATNLNSFNIFQSSSIRFQSGYNSNQEFLQSRYNKLKQLISSNHKQHFNINQNDIFAINQINLREINVYGFDYDYTLAPYEDEMQLFIYKNALQNLVDHFHFPSELLHLPFQPNFCIRGLHYDVNRSLMMKVDAFHIIQQGSVYRGLQQLEVEEVLQLFEGRRHIPKHILDQSFSEGSELLKQLMDVFSIPEMMLLANVVDYFDHKKMVYDPKILFANVQQSVRHVHVSGQLFEEVSLNIEKYLVKDSLKDLINHLKSSQKTLFLITNSGFEFVDRGMKFIAGSDWRDAFDLIIVNARKPSFFHKGKRPFRQVITPHISPEVSWERINSFQQHGVYCEGSISELMSISGWHHNEVLYFGDQIYNDLADVTFYYGWRTGAVIPELINEIDGINSKMYHDSIMWLQALEQLLERMQVYRDAESQQLITDWLHERESIKVRVKDIFNPYFGSIFRSHLAPSFFSSRLCRIADIYTSSVTNLVNYNLDHFFFPHRSNLPHERIINLVDVKDDDKIINGLDNKKPSSNCGR